LPFMSDEHHLLIKPQMKAFFTQKIIDDLQPYIESTVLNLMAEVSLRNASKPRGQRSIEIMEELAFPMTLGVASKFVGFPEADIPLVHRFTNHLIYYIGMEKSKESRIDENHLALKEYVTYCMALVEAHRNKPNPDTLITKVISNPEILSVMNDTLKLAYMVGFLIAGSTDNIASTIGLTLSTVLKPENRHVIQELHDNNFSDVIVSKFVEEALRHSTPTNTLSRRATIDINTDTLKASRGQTIVSDLKMANYDPHIFPEPEKFLLSRDNTDHLAFGRGRHLCSGRDLARLELRIFFKALFQNFPNMEFVNFKMTKNLVYILLPEEVHVKY